MAYNFNCHIKMEGLLNVTEVTYIAEVVMSQKWCNIETCLPQTTNGK